MINKDILFASLVGSKIVKMVPRLTAVQNQIGKHVLPEVPWPVNENKQNIQQTKFDAVEDLWKEAQPPSMEEQFFPLQLSIDEGKTWFLLPYEPMITINGGNTIIKRNVAKWNPDYSKDFFGTIKERWKQDDYDITITGILMGSKLRGAVEDCFPLDDFNKLNEFLTSGKVKVKSEPLNNLGIHYIAVESFSFPFTKGENVQAYNLKCCSDTSYYLLIEEKDA